MTVLGELDFDIIFEISKYLSLEDVVHLSQTCQQVREMLLNDSVSYQVVKANHAYTEEAQQARQEVMTYGEALHAIYDRRYAFSNARPYSARIVGQGNSILYQQGVLCVQTGHTVCITNLRSAKPGFRMDLEHILIEDRRWMDGDSIEMMYYRDEILTVHVTNKDRYNPNTGAPESWIVTMNIASGLSIADRILAIGMLGVCTRLFVRHTSRHIVFGTHDGRGGDGHRKWIIKIISINADELSGKNERILLEDFHGNDIGSTVAFEIHDGYFYAVSNQGTYEVEEVDWTSFYHCVRVPLDNPVTEAMQRNKRVYRRQHAEGAIHDSWTDLTLQHDERTNDLYIVESRREWVGATSKQVRTFYTSRISFDTSTDSSMDVDSSSNNVTPPLPLPENDILTTVLESSHRANYMRTPKQYSWTRHPEFPSTSDIAPNPQPFILARTKFRAYNFSCSAFVDLVEDEQRCPDRYVDSHPCLKLRIGSRRVAPAVFSPFGYEDRSSSAEYSLTLDGGERVQFADETQYRYTPIRMWPPPPSTCPCAARLHNIMNPFFRSIPGWNTGHKSTTTISDQRSIVYMVKPRDRPSSTFLGPLRSSSVSSTPGNIASRDVLGTIVFVDFGRSTIPPSSSANNKQRWDWAPGQRSRCKNGTCR